MFLRQRRGFTLIELLVVLLVGAVIIGALVSTLVSVLRGSSGLMHYSDMKHQTDRLLSYFSRDVTEADSLEFPALDSDEILAFQLYSNGSPSVTYSYGVDSDPPPGLSGTIYCIYREPFGGSRYEIATGFSAPPTDSQTGISSFFLFLDSDNNPLDHITSEGKRLAGRGTAKIKLSGTLQRGGRGDYPITHQVSTLSVLKNRVRHNNS